MAQADIFANPVMLTMLVLGVLGFGFMVRFLIAMAAELGKPRKVPHANETALREQFSHEAAANPAGSLAVGVARITRAISSNSGEWLVANERPMVNFRARRRTRGPSC